MYTVVYDNKNNPFIFAYQQLLSLSLAPVVASSQLSCYLSLSACSFHVYMPCNDGAAFLYLQVNCLKVEPELVCVGGAKGGGGLIARLTMIFFSSKFPIYIICYYIILVYIIYFYCVWLFCK